MTEESKSREQRLSAHGIFRIAVVSDIHYAAAAERARYAGPGLHRPDNPFVRLLNLAMQHLFWLSKPGTHNHQLDHFMASAGEPDLVVGNGDFSCNSASIGVSDPAAFESATECLRKLRDRFGHRFHGTIGDHELGKAHLYSCRGSMQLASWRRAVEDLRIEPFWRVQAGNYVVLGVTSSLIALPVFQQDTLPDELAQWEQLRETHLQQIRAAFSGLKPGERVLLFCHDPTALPFLWREAAVRERISQVEHTVIGHLHSRLILWKSRVLCGLPTISILGQGVRRMSTALGEAKHWNPFHVRLCPAITGIQLLKDGGFLTIELDADAIRPARFRFHPLKW
ncbi:MAG TPA: metallophosphoesterase [Verrucomicrobiota bacterium]|nr:metallophosphoesterase [Verrucomicrobiota bacterium]